MRHSPALLSSTSLNQGCSSDHYYPPYAYNLRKAASLARSHDKAFLVGEFDWTDRYYFPLVYLSILAPAVLAAGIWLLPARWWPWRISLGCCRRGRARRQRPVEQLEPDERLDKEGSTVALTCSASPLFPPAQSTAPTPSHSPATTHRRALLDHGVLFRRWHLSILILLICPILGGVIHAFLPTPLSTFLGTIESLSASSTLSGSFYWSLFGRDETCCEYVQHDDGYSLHYPTASGALSNDVEGRVVALTRHAWRMRGESPSWLTGDLGTLDVVGLPGIQCPQEALAVPANATWAGRL